MVKEKWLEDSAVVFAPSPVRARRPRVDRRRHRPDGKEKVVAAARPGCLARRRGIGGPIADDTVRRIRLGRVAVSGARPHSLAPGTMSPADRQQHRPDSEREMAGRIRPWCSLLRRCGHGDPGSIANDTVRIVKREAVARRTFYAAPCSIKGCDGSRSRSTRSSSDSCSGFAST